MAYLFIAAPYIIINAISGFKKNHSTLSQRVWMMLWIAYPSFVSCLAPFVEELILWAGRRGKSQSTRVCRVLLLLTSGCIVLGGLVTLSEMILENGMCIVY